MAWFMPSYGRPERLRELLDAPGGWPSDVFVMINEDDPRRDGYLQVFDQLKMSGVKAPWHLWFIAAGSRCADAHREIMKELPNEEFYGLLCDDQWPVTPNWHEMVREAAGRNAIATPAGEPSFPLLRNALVIGGDLARAMGSLVPVPVKHNYEDNLWDQIAKDFGALRPVPQAIVEHRHWVHKSAKKDATYEHGSADLLNDARVYKEWMASPEKDAVWESIAKLLGGNYIEFDGSKVLLAICVPIQDSEVDVAYHFSLSRTREYLREMGVSHKVYETSGGSHIGKARERTLWRAMHDEPKATHFLYIDADMGWDPELVVKLIAADHEFSGVAGVRKTKELSLCANFFSGAQEFHETTHFLSVKDVGFAFVLLKRSVIEEMCDSYPELEYDAGDEKREWALFLDMIDGRERLSEDFSFCRRWRAIGGKIWLDPNSALIHAGRAEYTGMVRDVFEVGPQTEAAE